MNTPLTLTNTQFTIIIICCAITILVGWCTTFFIIRKNPRQLETALKEVLLPKLLTIILVLFATVILALTDKLNEAPAAILSGIVGYVLGTTNTSKDKEPTKDEDRTA